ncbi:MAG: hypothetical protein ACTSRF_11550 [Candidatus Freyarchaeota archaeon]
MTEEENVGTTEQREVMAEVEKIRKEFKHRGISWNRFRGDAISRVVARYLKGHLPDGFKPVRLAWIEGCPTEFDLLIVDKDAEPIGFTGAYPKDKVHLLIEIKGSGVFYRKKEVEQRLSKLFDSWRETTGKPILYLCFWERPSYAKSTLRALGEDTAFILQIGKEIKLGEWDRFIQKVKSMLRT